MLRFKRQASQCVGAVSLAGLNYLTILKCGTLIIAGEKWIVTK
jgi:hypothetical protein